MVQTLVEVVVAPLLAAAATVACRRWGARVGGVVSAFPAIVGPVLLVAALAHGAGFAAKAANGTLLGLLTLSAFALAYGHAARRGGWRLSMAVAWTFAALAAALLALAGHALGEPAGMVVATLSLGLAYRMLPPIGGERPPSTPLTLSRGEIPVRMALTALLVTALATAASRLGPLVGGVLAAIPVLASVLAVLTHRKQGSGAVIALLRGMVAGMLGFVAFCEIIALLIVPAGLATAFATATIAALVLQALTAYLPLSPGSLAVRGAR
jgi:hypothetical protein